MDSDREDGEVSDAEASSRTPAGIAMRQRYPEPPRSAPQPAVLSSRAEEAYNPDKPSAGQTTPQAPVPKVAPQQSAIVSEADQVQQQREEAKQFIRLLNANNIGYHALAKEKIDVELLRGMYRSMNLPSEPEPIPLPKTNGAAAKPSTATQPKGVPAVSTNIAAASAASAAASPVDRKDYLARLQAAKLARQSGPAKASPPQKSSPVTTASPALDNGTPQAIMTPTRKPAATDEQKARQTELIKQRLEALKAQSKQGTTQKTSAQPASAVSASASAPQTPAASFSNIPGLFMNGPSSVGNGASTPSRQPQAVPQKRPVPSDTSISTPRGSVTPYNRLYGQSPHHHEDSMIIEVSDDESNGSDMDIDEDQGLSTSTAIRQAPVSIPGFPPRQAPVPAAASAVSTPGPQTPATLARTGELSTKEQELAALKLTLKKKLAEQKRIREAAEAASAAASAATIAQQETSSKQSQLSLSAGAQEAAAPATVQAGTPASDSSRDRKRRRRTEIQEQLPTLDDEIASNEAEMARLAKDLERLRTNNERIMQDKQRLTRELEDLGIDTEGMSHADMRATKDEIERAQSPEKEATPQTNVLPQASPPGKEPGAPVTAPVEMESAQTTELTPTHTVQPNSAQLAPPQYGLLPGLRGVAPPATVSSQLRIAQQPVQEQSADQIDIQPSTVSHLEPPEGPGRVAAVNDRASATPMDDDEDFYSPPPLNEIDANTEAPVAEIPEPQIEQAIANTPSPSEEGEVEMSVSSEEEDQEEYEPEEPIVGGSVVQEPVVEAQVVNAPTVNEPASVPSPHRAAPAETQIEQSQSAGQSQVSTEDEEAYEPPDVDEEMTEVAPVVEVAQAEALVPQPSSPGDANEGAMDIATSSSDESDNSDLDSDEETESEREHSESQTHAAPQDVNIADDLAPELQPDTSFAVVPATEHIEDVSSPPILEISLTSPGARR
jgi:archaellum component FlaC